MFLVTWSEQMLLHKTKTWWRSRTDYFAEQQWVTVEEQSGEYSYCTCCLMSECD